MNIYCQCVGRSLLARPMRGWGRGGLLAAAALGALAIPLLEGTAQVLLLLGSTLLVGIAGAFELTARNKYCSLLVEDPQDLAGYLASFSVVFDVGKLVGPPIGGLLVALAGPAWALGIDAARYLLQVHVRALSLCSCPLSRRVFRCGGGLLARDRGAGCAAQRACISQCFTYLLHACTLHRF